MYSEIESLTKQRVAQLWERNRVFFCFLCCQRMIPGYAKFCKNERFGDVFVAYSAMNIIEEYCRGKSLNKEQLEAMLPELYESTPDSNDYPSVLASYAERAVASIYYTLNYILKGDIAELTYVPLAIYESIDLYIQEQEEFVDDSEVPNHKLMVEELNRQGIICEKLVGVKLNESIIDSLQQENKGISVIGVNLFEI